MTGVQTCALPIWDWPVVMGGVIIIVFIVMIVNLLVDLSYALLDPRIRYGGSSS